MARLWLCVLAPYSILSHQRALSASWAKLEEFAFVILQICVVKTKIKILVKPFSFYFYLCETK